MAGTTSRKYFDDELLRRDRDLQRHLEILGLKSITEYKSWCEHNGFSARVNKHWHQRARERYHAAQKTIQDRIVFSKLEKRNPRRVIEQIFDNSLDSAALTQPHLRRVQQLVISSDDQVRESFRQLILHVEGRAALLTLHPGWPSLGIQIGNTLIDGLFELSRCSRHWRRSPDSWTPLSHSARRQFSALAAHLFNRFPVPAFMDSVWFLGPSEYADRKQTLYRALGAGQSPRQLDFPIRLTKAMVHPFLQAPHQLSVEHALRWAQVIGLGGDQPLARAILGSRLGSDFENDDFWATVIEWMIGRAMFDPAQLGPIIDYIQHQKFGPITHDDDGLTIQPPQPEFSIKGRTPLSLLRQMHEWHLQLRKEKSVPQREWPTSEIGSFEWCEGTSTTCDLRCWTIVELCSSAELQFEGRMMQHCVASYDLTCLYGGTSIWSCGLQRNHGKRKRMLTIEVANRTKTIRQVRGKANRLPTEKELEIVRRWAVKENLNFA